MQRRTYDIKGMSCAACVANVERAVRSLEGVSDVNVMLMKNRMTLVADENILKEGGIETAVAQAGYEASISGSASKLKSADDREEKRQKLQLILSVVLTLILMSISMGNLFHLNAQTSAYVQLIITLGVMFLQRKYFISAKRAIVHFNFNMDTLVSLGSLSAVVFSLISLAKISPEMSHDVLMKDVPLYFESACGILTFVAVGKFFEERGKVKTTDAISRLYDLAPKLVTVVKDGVNCTMPLEDVKLDDIVILTAGEQLGIDGVVIEGQGFCDESALSGESAPVKKLVGSKVLSASVLLDGYLKVRAQAVGADTTLAKIISLVDEASNQKAPIARIADTIASYFVPAVISVAILTFIVWYFIVGESFALAINFAISVLVVSCPCALGLATPVAIMAATGLAAKAGILFKSPEVLENLRKASIFVFDKTGTLTYGHMQVVSIITNNAYPENLALLFAASLEQKSSHPLAKAFVKKANAKELFPVADYAFKEGLGVVGKIINDDYALGNLKLAKSLGIEVSDNNLKLYDDYAKKGFNVLFLYKNREVLALFVIGDEIKAGAFATIKALHERGLKTLMLTGDNDKVAHSVAQSVNIGAFKAGLLPQDKATIIKSLNQQHEQTVMIGDGINDSVSLTQAHTGIGLAGTSDIALSACDVVLLRENLYDIVNAYEISKKTIRIIKENLFWAFIYNVVFIPVAAGAFYSTYGLKFTPMMAALLMSLSSLCVVANALRLTRQKISLHKDTKEENKLMIKTIKISGMHCEHCVAAVTKTLQSLPGVSAVKVSLDKAEAVANIPEIISDSIVKSSIEALGFEVKEIK